MRSEISSYPNTYLQVELDQGEHVLTERGSMIFAQGDYSISTKYEVKNLNSWILRILEGKSFRYNIYQAKSKTSLLFTPDKNGELLKLDVSDKRPIIIEPSAHFARIGEVELTMIKQSAFKNFWDGFKMRTKGKGELVLIGYGKIIEKVIDTEKEIWVDEDYLLAYDESLEVRAVTRGVKELVSSGEGFLYGIKGKGNIWLQTREESSMKKGGGIISSILDFFR